MRLTATRLALVTALAALVVFCVVQDRGTAEAVGRYVDAQRLAQTQRAPPVSLDGVLVPGVRESVRRAAAWSGVVAIVGLTASAVVGVRSRRG